MVKQSCSGSVNMIIFLGECMCIFRSRFESWGLTLLGEVRIDGLKAITRGALISLLPNLREDTRFGRSIM